MEVIKRYFKFDKFETNLLDEILAGFSLFLGIAYIFILAPSLLAQAGVPQGAAFAAAVVASGLTTFFMGIYAKLPFACAPGITAVSFFTFVVVGSLGFSWQEALGIVFWSGVLMVAFTLLPIRKALIDSIPERLKIGISATVGIFIALVGLSVSGIINLEGGKIAGFGSLYGVNSAVLIIGFLICLLLSLKLRNGQVLFSGGVFVAIIGSAVLYKLFSPAAEPAQISNEAISLTGLAQFDPFVIFKDPRAWSVLIVFFLLDFFDSVGTFIGLTRQTNLQSDGEVKNLSQALHVDGAGTIVGSCLGTSTVVTFIESAIAVGQGGRTGIPAIVCSVLVFATLFAAPLLTIVPIEAVGGVLVYVGWLLLPKAEIKSLIAGASGSSTDFSWVDFTIAMTMIFAAAFTFSLDKPLLVGFTLYFLVTYLTKRKANYFMLGCALALLIPILITSAGLI